MVKINIGKSAGVEIGQRFKPVNEQADLQVIEIHEDHCLAKILNAEKPLNVGQRVEKN